MKSYTSNSAQTIKMDIPPDVTANECAQLSECSLCRVWHRPNLRTRIVIFLTRLGIGVHRCKNIDELFMELNR